MGYVPRACPICGTSVTTAGPCGACMGDLETQPEQETDRLQNKIPGRGEGKAPMTISIPVSVENIKEAEAHLHGALEESAPISQKTWGSLAMDGAWPPSFCRECKLEITPDLQVDIEGFKDLCYPCYSKQPKRVCVDLDGVLALYEGWKGTGHFGDPRPGAREFLTSIQELGFRTYVFTTRRIDDVWEWLNNYDLAHLVKSVVNHKLPAVAYIDDRAINFQGNFEETLTALRGFRPFWKPRVVVNFPGMATSGPGQVWQGEFIRISEKLEDALRAEDNVTVLNIIRCISALITMARVLGLITLEDLEEHFNLLETPEGKDQ